MKKIILVSFLLLTYTWAAAQSNVGVTVAVSKSDNHMETVWYQHQLSPLFSVGVQLRNSDVRYRFVNARAIDRGNTVFAGLTLGFKIREREKYRLDFNLTTSYRRLENEEVEKLPQFTDGIEIDPNLIFSLKTNQRFIYHTGIMLRMATQLGPESIPSEQQPSAILLNGLSYQINKSSLTLRTYVGPMSGAGGDTEKFFWQVSVGYQYSFGKRSDSSISFINF